MTAPTSNDEADLLITLKDMRRALFEHITALIRGGGAGHQELAIARNLLKDNGLCLLAVDDGDEGEDARRKAAADLPELEDDDGRDIY